MRIYANVKKIKFLFLIIIQHIMDEKKEDKSEESKKNHIRYYRSLTKIIEDMKNEMVEEGEPAIKEHIDSRIEAMEKDRKRIRDLFPNMKLEEWDANTK